MPKVRNMTRREFLSDIALGREIRGAMTMREDLHGNKVSLLGYGAMRLPTKDGGHANNWMKDASSKAIDQEEVNRHIDFALEHALASICKFSHFLCNMLLSDVFFHFVEFGGHKVVVRGCHFVDEHRGQGCEAEQPFGMMQVHQAYAGHHGGAVHQSQSVAQMQLQRFDVQQSENFGGRSAATFVENFPFADERQCHVGASRFKRYARCSEGLFCLHQRRP